MDLGGDEGREAVHEGNADVDFVGLAVGVSGVDAFSEGFQAAHLRFDPTSGVIARPALPEGPAIVVEAPPQAQAGVPDAGAPAGGRNLRILRMLDAGVDLRRDLICQIAAVFFDAEEPA